jgi:hypothetical protein
MFGAPKNAIDVSKIFFRKNILVKSPYYEKGKKREKGNTTLFFATTEHYPRNNSFKKEKSLPLPKPLNKTPLFFKFIKTPHLKTNPLRDRK